VQHDRGSPAIASCLRRKNTFPEEFHITHSVQDTTEQWIDHVLAPYIARKKDKLQLPPDQPALCILHLFAAHRVEGVLTAFNKNKIRVAFVPGGCTGELQPLDLSCNDPFKETLAQQFSDWYASRITDAPDDGTPIKVDMRLTAIKPTHADWLVKAWRELRENRAAITRGWHQAGIVAAVTAEEEIDDEPAPIDIIID
jgi:hypothetical protein